MTSLASVVKVQLLGARKRQWSSPFSAVTAIWRLLPATESTQLGRGMNAYKYQKFLEGLSHLRGIAGLLAPRLPSSLAANTCCGVRCMDLYAPSVRRGLERPDSEPAIVFPGFGQRHRRIEFVNVRVGGGRRGSSRVL